MFQFCEYFRRFGARKVDTRKHKPDVEYNVPTQSFEVSYSMDVDERSANTSMKVPQKEKSDLKYICSQNLDSKFLQKLNSNSASKGIVIVGDSNSREIIRKSVTHSLLKRSGIACDFDFKELSNDVTKDLNVVIVINITELSETEFETILTELRSINCKCCNLFLINDDLSNETTSTRISTLKQRMQRNTGSENKERMSLQMITAFTLYDDNIVVIDTIPNLDYIKYMLNETKPETNEQSLRLCRKIAFRLVNVFDEMGELPNVRFFKANDFCRFIANLFVKQIENKYKRSDKYSKNYTLVVIDRSIDLLTPIVHSCKFEEFVCKELQREYKSGHEEIDRKMRDLNISKVVATLIELSQKSKCAQINSKISKDIKNMENIALSKHVENAYRMSRKIKSGYASLLNIEAQILEEKSSKNANELVIKQFLQSAHKEIIPFDVIRLLTIHLWRDYSNKVRWQKLLANKRQLHSMEKDKIMQFAKIAKQIETKNCISLQSICNTPVIAKIIADFKSNALDANTFPAVYDSPEKRENVFVYILGGLSYSELQYSRIHSNADQRVILCSDSLLTPAMLYEHLLKHASS